MFAEIDKISPVQFIEGRNKFAEPAKLSGASPDAYAEYVPMVSYSIARIDIFIAWEPIGADQDNRLVIYADYLDHPTDIILTEGSMKFKQGEEPYESWRTVEIAQPVVLIAHKKYWLQFSNSETKFNFYAAAKGDQITVKTKSDNKWETASDILMFRFYGRILPLAILH